LRLAARHSVGVLRADEKLLYHAIALFLHPRFIVGVFVSAGGCSMKPGLSMAQGDPAAALVGYTFVRHIGFILDELSDQGLELWRDEHGSWRWRWRGTPLQTERGFWALGEAVVDAIVTRYPAVFATDAHETAE
jgi:hypothetical protein